jgi:hypothetical protein
MTVHNAGYKQSNAVSSTTALLQHTAQCSTYADPTAKAKRYLHDAGSTMQTRRCLKYDITNANDRLFKVQHWCCTPVHMNKPVDAEHDLLATTL